MPFVAIHSPLSNTLAASPLVVDASYQFDVASTIEFCVPTTDVSQKCTTSVSLPENRNHPNGDDVRPFPGGITVEPNTRRHRVTAVAANGQGDAESQRVKIGTIVHPIAAVRATGFGPVLLGYLLGVLSLFTFWGYRRFDLSGQTLSGGAVGLVLGVFRFDGPNGYVAARAKMVVPAADGTWATSIWLKWQTGWRYNAYVIPFNKKLDMDGDNLMNKPFP